MKRYSFNNKGNILISIAVVLVAVGLLGGGLYVYFSKQVLKAPESAEKTSEEVNTSASANDNNLLGAICSNAINDYPEWTKADTDLIIWENPDKTFNFRNSPEDKSSRLTSPIPPTKTLADMDFLGLNEISYVITGGDNWKISILKLNGLGAYDNSLVYEKTEAVSFINISPINKKEFIVLVVNGNKGVLEQINAANSKEEIISEIPSINIDKLKLSVSPRGTYVYLLQGDSLIFFEIDSKKQIDKISSANSAVWVGDKSVLYSGSEGTFIYNVGTKEKNKLDKPGIVSDLTFNPKENGVIAFNENGDTKVVNCQTWQIINTKQGTELKTLTSEKTAITKKGDQFGYWRFKDNDWGVKILEEKSKFVTVWQGY